MPSFLSRIRALSQATSASSIAESTTSPVSPRTPNQSQETSLETAPPLSRLLDRRIHPDINSLVDSSSSRIYDEILVSGGLSPPPKRPRSEEVLQPQKRRSITAHLTEEPSHGSEYSTTTQFEDIESPPRTSSKGKAPAIMPILTESPRESQTVYRMYSSPVLGSTEGWSTFGRREERGRPDAVQLEELLQSTTKSRSPSRQLGMRRQTIGASKTSSVRSTATFTRPAIPSRPNSSPQSGSGSKPPSRQSSGKWSSSHQESARDSTPHTVSSRAAGSVRRPPSDESIPPLPSPPPHLRMSSTSRSQSTTFDSPHNTFGYPTPAQPSPSVNPPASPYTAALTSTPLYEKDTDFNDLPASFQDPTGTHQQELYPFNSDFQPATSSQIRTPQHQRQRSASSPNQATSFISTIAFPTLPFTFGRSTARSPSRHFPKASSLFPSQKSRSTSRNSPYRSRESSDHKRRESAEQIAEQATKGTTSSPSTDYGWPADVSRAIINLSLGRKADNKAAASTTGSRATAKLKDKTRLTETVGHTKALKPDMVTQTRDSHVPSPTRHRTDQSEIEQAVLSSRPFPSPPPTLPLPPLPPPSKAASSSLFPLLQRYQSERLARTLPRQDTQRWRQALRGSVSDLSGSDNYSARRVISLNDLSISRPGRLKRKHSRSKRIMEASTSSGSIFNNTSHESTADKRMSTGEFGHIVIEDRFTYSTHPSLSSVPPIASSSSFRPIASLPSGVTSRSGTLSAPDAQSTPQKSNKSQGKRKAEEDSSNDGSPPHGGKSTSLKTTFAVKEGGQRGQRVSNNSSTAPSSFNTFPGRKRARISTPQQSRTGSRPGSPVNASELGSTSRATGRPQTPHGSAKPASKATSITSSGLRRSHDRRSISRVSIPVSAFISPHPQSIDQLSTTYHMRDPRKPQPRAVGWGLRRKTIDDEASPIQAWFFWFGFVMPMLWWLGAFWRIRRTRTLSGGDSEKATMSVDDPFYEREARSWRLRCRVVSVLFFFTYVPVIVLLAIFVPR